jgi:transcriptional regulator with XRE-family HTH domain
MTQAGIQDTTGNQDGPRIRQLREARDLSVPQLAGAVGVHPQSLRNIELNRRPAGLATLCKIADQLGVRLDYLLKSAAQPAAPHN